MGWSIIDFEMKPECSYEAPLHLCSKPLTTVPFFMPSIVLVAMVICSLSVNLMACVIIDLNLTCGFAYTVHVVQVKPYASSLQSLGAEYLNIHCLGEGMLPQTSCPVLA